MRVVRAFLSVFVGALLLSGCTTTASRELVAAIKAYDTRSHEAIAAVERVERKSVEQPPVPASTQEQLFLSAMLDSRVPLRGRDANNQPVDGQGTVDLFLDPYATSVSRSGAPILALEEMRCVHGSFTNAFASLESAGLLGKRPVADRAPAILDQLITQQIMTAQVVAGPLRTDMRAYKAALIAEILRIRGSTVIGEEQKKEAMLGIRAQWLAIQAEENEYTTTAVASLLKAAETGLALRKQLVAYGDWSLSDFIDTANALTGAITRISGTDLTGLNGEIVAISGQIQSDPDLSGAFARLAGQIPVPALASEASRAQAAAAARAVPRTTFPCLSRQTGLPAPANEEPTNGGQ